MKKYLGIIAGSLSSCVAAFAGFTQDDAAGWYAVTDDGYAVSDGLTITRGEDGSLTLGLDNNESWSAKVDGVNYYAFTLAVTLDFDKITTPESNVSMFTLATSTVTGFGLNATTSYLQGWWGSAIYAPDPPKKSPILTQTLTGIHTIVFTFDNAGSRFYLDSETVYYSGADLKGNVGTASSLLISATAAEGLIQVVGWADGCCGGTIDDDKVAAAVAFNTADTLSIPEPSAFGLLAGVGVIAFVAARRRRKTA